MVSGEASVGESSIVLPLHSIIGCFVSYLSEGLDGRYFLEARFLLESFSLMVGGKPLIITSSLWFSFLLKSFITHWVIIIRMESEFYSSRLDVAHLFPFFVFLRYPLSARGILGFEDP